MSTETTEAPFVVSHNFCAVRANTVEELRERLTDFASDDNIAALISGFRNAVSSHPAPMQGVTQVVAQAPAPATTQEAVNNLNAGGITGTVVQGGESSIEQRDDQWGNKYIKGSPDNGTCNHGPRIAKSGTSKAGKAYKSFVCVNDSPFREGKYDKSAVCEVAWPSR